MDGETHGQWLHLCHGLPGARQKDAQKHKGGLLGSTSHT